MAFSVVKIYTSNFSNVSPSTSPSTTVILWVSRHPPLKEQIAELERKFGAIIIYQVSGVIPGAEAVVDVAAKVGASVIVPILPLSMLARLAELRKNFNFIVLFAKMNCIHTTADMAEAQKLVNEMPSRRSLATHADGLVRVYEFERFEKLVEVKVVTEPL